MWTVLHQLHSRRRAIPSSIAPLRHAVADLAARGGATERECQDIALAVSEALSNAVRHAYSKPSCSGMVVVRAAVADGVLNVEISDEGVGMPAPADHPLTGQGLAMIAKLADHVELHSMTPGTRLRMTFAIG